MKRSTLNVLSVAVVGGVMMVAVPIAVMLYPPYALVVIMAVWGPFSSWFLFIRTPHRPHREVR